LFDFMGGTYAEIPEKYREASPVTHVSPDDPPIMLIHGTADATVPFRQSVIMKERLEAAGVPVELVAVEGAGHGWNTGTTRAQRIGLRETSMAFMIKHLMGE
jgi:dipeptidyl aminopeptidase/acylaminoacyl peptidase